MSLRLRTKDVRIRLEGGPDPVARQSIPQGKFPDTEGENDACEEDDCAAIGGHTEDFEQG